MEYRLTVNVPLAVFAWSYNSVFVFDTSKMWGVTLIILNTRTVCKWYKVRTYDEKERETHTVVQEENHVKKCDLIIKLGIMQHSAASCEWNKDSCNMKKPMNPAGGGRLVDQVWAVRSEFTRSYISPAQHCTSSSELQTLRNKKEIVECINQKAYSILVCEIC